MNRSDWDQGRAADHDDREPEHNIPDAVADEDPHSEMARISPKINAGFAHIATARREHPEWFPLLTSKAI